MIVFNESAIEDFLAFDRARVFIVVSPLQRDLFKVEVQHVSLTI